MIQCNIRDITEHKRIFDALKENEKKYHDLVNQCRDGIFLVDLSGKILTTNKAMCRELGYSEEEFLSMNIWDIIPEQYLEQYRKRLKKILQGKSLEEAAEYAVRGKDGLLHYIEVLSAPHYSGIDIIGFQGIARDITSHKEAEEALLASEARYRHTLDDMFEGCQILGFDWRYLYVNDAAAWHGHQAKETLVGHTMMEIYPDIENTELFAALRRCMNERTSHQMENEFAYPDGMKGWFEPRIQPVPEGVFILSIDITAHKQAEEALQRSQQETAHVNSLLVALSQAAQSVQRALTTEEVYRAIQDQMSDLGLHATGSNSNRKVSAYELHSSVFAVTWCTKQKNATGFSLHTFHFQPRADTIFHRTIVKGEPSISRIPRKPWPMPCQEACAHYAAGGVSVQAGSVHFCPAKCG